MVNREHTANYEFRPAHTAKGELGVTVKRYVSSGDRASQTQAYWKKLQATPTGFNQKTQKRDGNFLRPTAKTQHLNQALCHQKHDDFSRVTSQVAKHGRDYLPESFNLDMASNPVWHETNKQKWLTANGFDHNAGA